MKKNWLFVAMLVVLGGRRVVLAQAAAGTPAPDVQAQVEGLVKIQRAWGAPTSTPNMGLTLVETSRSTDGIRMGMRTAGLPSGKTYTLVSWPITTKDPITAMDGVTLDRAGIPICAGTPGTCKGNQPDDPIELVLRPIAGEPVRLALISADQSVKVLRTSYQFRCEAQTKDAQLTPCC